MERILNNGKETRGSQEKRHLTPSSCPEKGNSTGTVRTPLSPVAFIFRGYTPWSIQANHSETRCSKASTVISSNYSKPRSSIAQNKDAKYLNNPWRIISAPSSYVYSYCAGTFTNGRGCTWTPYYLHFPNLKYTHLSINEPTQVHVTSAFKKTKSFQQTVASNELIATKSWIWSEHPQPEKHSRRKTFTNLMRSPYLRAHGHNETSCSSRKLQSSDKCEAWLKSNQ